MVSSSIFRFASTYYYYYYYLQFLASPLDLITSPTLSVIMIIIIFLHFIIIKFSVLLPFFVLAPVHGSLFGAVVGAYLFSVFVALLAFHSISRLDCFEFAGVDFSYKCVCCITSTTRLQT